MIELIQFYPTWDLPNVSPFCMKVEVYLKLAHIPYTNRYSNDPKATPTGKKPAIKDGDSFIYDSRLIINYLEAKFGNPLDAHLTASEKATAHAFQRMIEEHLYWGIVYSRWIMPEGLQRITQDWFGKLPWLLRKIVMRKLHKKVLNEMKGQGLGLLKHEEIVTLCNEDIDAISDFLGEKPFFMGDKISSIDACVYATLANIIETPIHWEVTEHAKSKANLLAYCSRIKAKTQTTHDTN